MDSIIDFFEKHYPWIFSGIGVTIIGLILKFLLNKSSQYQKIGNNSKGIQIGGNYTRKIIKSKSDKEMD